MDASESLGVVVPTLDEAHTLPALLARLSGAAEGDRADSIVVADGGSRDGTRELALRAGAQVVRTEAGRGRQLAAGARLLNTELLLVLHADCRPEAGALAALRAAFRDPSLRVAALHQRIEARGALYRLIERAADMRCARLGLVYGDSGLAVRRSAYEEVGGFRELPLFEDVDLSRRLARRSPVRLIPDAHLCVSARRWRREGPLRCTLRNWILTGAYLAGVAPARLARYYKHHSSPPAT